MKNSQRLFLICLLLLSLLPIATFAESESCLFQPSGRLPRGPYIRTRLNFPFIKNISIERKGKTYAIISDGNPQTIYLSDFIGTEKEITENNYSLKTYPKVTLHFEFQNTEKLGERMKNAVRVLQRSDPSSLPLQVGLVVPWRFVGQKKILFFKFKEEKVGIDAGTIASFGKDFEFILGELDTQLPKAMMWGLKEKRRNVRHDQSRILFDFSIYQFGHLGEAGAEEPVPMLQVGINGFTGRNRPGEE